MHCPCHSGRRYKECCQPYHAGEAAPTPETLMRSRYSAYALGLVSYIQKSQIEEGNGEEIELFCRNTDFRDLQILSTDKQHVTFHATLFQGCHDVSFTERSLFEKHAERWVYARKVG